MLRGPRDFANRKDYEGFLKRLFERLNTGRQKWLEEELKVLRRLPSRKLPICKRLTVSVTGGSTIRVYAECLEVLYAQRCVERIPRLRGEGRHHIQYRHIIEWFVRKPGAFKNYRYREDLFPTVRFRMAFDSLKRERTEQRAAKEYLRILLCALGHELIFREYRILFRPCGLLVQELLRAKRDLTLTSMLKQFSRYDALIIDDIGYVQQSREEMGVLFSLLSYRCG